MENKTLFQLTEEMLALEDALYENGGELTEEMESAFAETENDLRNKVDSYFALTRKLDLQAEACASEIKRIQAIKKTAENSVKNLKSRLLYAMDLLGLAKLEGETCKLSIRTSKVGEVDEEKIYAPFLESITAIQNALPEYISVEFKINKTALKEASQLSAIDGYQQRENKNLIMK